MKSSGRQPARKQKCMGRANIYGEGRGRRTYPKTCTGSPQVEKCASPRPREDGAVDDRGQLC